MAGVSLSPLNSRPVILSPSKVTLAVIFPPYPSADPSTVFVSTFLAQAAKLKHNKRESKITNSFFRFVFLSYFPL